MFCHCGRVGHEIVQLVLHEHVLLIVGIIGMSCVIAVLYAIWRNVLVACRSVVFAKAVAFAGDILCSESLVFLLSFHFLSYFPNLLDGHALLHELCDYLRL